MKFIDKDFVEIEGKDIVVVYSQQCSMAIVFKCEYTNVEGVDIEVKNKSAVIKAIRENKSNNSSNIESVIINQENPVYVVAKGSTLATCVEETVDVEGKVGYDISLVNLSYLERERFEKKEDGEDRFLKQYNTQKELEI